MSRRVLLSFACALPLCLALSARSACARTQARNSDANATRLLPSQNGADGQKSPFSIPTKSGKAKVDPLPFEDVPADSPLYAAVTDLQQQGVVAGYPDGYFRGRRPLTYYEFGVAMTRVVKDWDVLTLAPDGKTLETVVAVPRNLSREQAQALLKVWTEIRTKIAASGFGAAKANLIIRTLRAYVVLLTNNNPVKPAPPNGANPNPPKEPKP